VLHNFTYTSKSSLNFVHFVCHISRGYGFQWSEWTKREVILCGRECDVGELFRSSLRDMKRCSKARVKRSESRFIKTNR